MPPSHNRCNLRSSTTTTSRKRMAINIKPQLVRQQPAYLGNMGPRGMGLSSRSRAIFVAACKPYDDRPCISDPTIHVR